jgi:hypothetical protein
MRDVTVVAVLGHCREIHAQLQSVCRAVSPMASGPVILASLWDQAPFCFQHKSQCEAAVSVAAGSYKHTFDGGRLTRLKES